VATINRRGTAAQPANNSTPVGGIALGLAIYGAIELFGFGYCSWQQLTTTHDSIVAMIQGGVLIPSHMTAQQLLEFLQTNNDKYNKIAWAVAIITQIIYWGTALPGAPLHNRWLHLGITGGFFILEVITDLWYSSVTGTTLGGAFTYVFNLGNGGWIVSLSYIAAMSAGSMFLGVRGTHHLSKALGPVFEKLRQTA
jgi:hypothetical protein